MNERLIQLQDWLTQAAPAPVTRIEPAAQDASVRRYFRIHCGGVSYIAMDAPPAQLDCRPFVRIADTLRAVGLHTPEIFAADFEQGFLLLGDLGDQPYLGALTPANVEVLYRDALAALLRLQLHADPLRAELPNYDRAFVERELVIFCEWYLHAYRSLTLSVPEQAIVEAAFTLLCDTALEQPRLWVHRDFHSRNLMVSASNNPGILDFQDSVYGPLSYDLVSLLRDCYIAWPPPQVERWALDYFRQLHAAGYPALPDQATFRRWFDLMGLQRHLKAIGIFARLHLRDGKPGYLTAIPRTLGYARHVAARYAELADFNALLARALP